MTDRHRDKVDYEGEGQPFDSEIDTRAIVGFAAFVVVLCAAAFWLMWGMFGFFEGELEGADPPPSPLAEANERRLPPAPRLQSHPEVDLIDMRAEEEAELHRYGWSDEGAGLARVPIEQAMTKLVADGLPQWELPAAEGTAETSVEGSGAAGGADPEEKP